MVTLRRAMPEFAWLERYGRSTDSRQMVISILTRLRHASLARTDDTSHCRAFGHFPPLLLSDPLDGEIRGGQGGCVWLLVALRCRRDASLATTECRLRRAAAVAISALLS